MKRNSITNNSVKIGAHHLAIQQTEMEDCGQIDVFHETININSHMALSRKGETLLHEAGHSFATTLSESDIGHALWDSLASQMWQFLWDNELINEKRLEELLGGDSVLRPRN